MRPDADDRDYPAESALKDLIKIAGLTDDRLHAALTDADGAARFHARPIGISLGDGHDEQTAYKAVRDLTDQALAELGKTSRSSCSPTLKPPAAYGQDSPTLASEQERSPAIPSPPQPTLRLYGSAPKTAPCHDPSIAPTASRPAAATPGGL